MRPYALRAYDPAATLRSVAARVFVGRGLQAVEIGVADGRHGRALRPELPSDEGGDGGPDPAAVPFA